ncbi:hypothetical protein B0O99DRAFT_342552 [Bisporella sp. PMI_857]|nr:hypothetical protein B0O99DRAFT_342552 [Bisporella sp. PMI_857]
MAQNEHTLVAVTIGFLVSTVILVSLRTYTRFKISKAYGWDDVLMLLCLAIYITMAVLIILGCKAGIGQEAHNLPLAEVNRIKYTLFIKVTYILLTSMVKASIGASLLRITQSRAYSYVVWAALAIVIALCVSVISINLSFCIPTSYIWNKAVPLAKGTCRDRRFIIDAGYALSAGTVFLDILFVIIPYSLLWNLQLQTHVKVTAMLVMSLGIFASIATIIRLRYFIKSSNTTYRLLYNMFGLLIWSVVEAGMGIAAACMMTLRPLARKLRIMGSSNLHSPGDFRDSTHSWSVRMQDWPASPSNVVEGNAKNLGTGYGSEEEILGMGIIKTSGFVTTESRAAV